MEMEMELRREERIVKERRSEGERERSEGVKGRGGERREWEE